jgi:hypothetical protein
MNGVELTRFEFAYLLATLNCNEVIGLDDPSLFPQNASVRGKTLKKGRQELETHGWITPIPDQPDDFELDAMLLETVSIIASPDFMIATTHTAEKDQTRLVFHYLGEGSTVELAVQDEKNYRLGLLPEQGEMFGRIYALMQLSPDCGTAELRVDQTTFEKIVQYVHKGKYPDAEELLASFPLKEAEVKSLLSAIESNSRGGLVVVRVDSGEITDGRRLSIYGSGDVAWMAIQVDSETTDFGLRPCSEASIGEFVAHFQADLSN